MSVSNPITYPIEATGTGVRYDCYNDNDIDNVPWGALTAGSVVNIFYKASPYTRKLALASEATAQNPIIVNGVSDANGNRPAFNFIGSRTAKGCNPSLLPAFAGDTQYDIFNTGSPYSLEDYAGIIFRFRITNFGGIKPKFIQIKNIDMSGVGRSYTFTNLLGNTVSYIGGSAGIRVQHGADITIENCIITDCENGIFTQISSPDLWSIAERITLRSCRIYENGRPGSELEHNVYMQCINPIVEGCFIGKVKDSAGGSTYKSRSSGEIFRYNWVEGSVRTLDFVEPEEQIDGQPSAIIDQDDYGIDHIYGNVFVTDLSVSKAPLRIFRFGSDHFYAPGANDVDQPMIPLGDPGPAALLVSPEINSKKLIRQKLFFYNNTIICNSGQNQRMFQISETTAIVECWNNLFYLSSAGSSSYASGLYFINERAGTINFRAGNIIYTDSTAPAASVADFVPDGIFSSYTDVTKAFVNYQEAAITADPMLSSVATYDYMPGQDGSAISVGTTEFPAGITSGFKNLSVNYQPVTRGNGLVARTSVGTVGAFEFGSSPNNVTAVPVGTILTAAHATWSNDFQANRYTVQRKFQWLRNGFPIDDAVGTAYTTQDNDIGASISLQENAWYINENNPGTTKFIPIMTSQSVSSSIVVTGTVDEELVYQDNLNYLGSFRLTSPAVSNVGQSLAYGGHGLTMNPNGYGGLKTMITVGYAARGYSYAGEISVPTLESNTDPFQLSASTLVRPAAGLTSPTEGQLTSSGITGGTDPETWGLQVIPGSEKMLVTGLNWYSNNTYNAFWRRPRDLNVQQQVEGPFVVIDPTYQTNPRWTSGWMCNIPLNYQSALGGNMLASLSGISISSNASNGPSAIVFDTDNIDAALAEQHSGIAQGGSARTIILASTASATTGTYVGQYIYVPGCSSTALVITAYDGTSKEATVAPSGTASYWDISVPTDVSTYNTSPVVAGRQLVGYALGNEVQAPSVFNPIWRQTSYPRGMCIPNGTRSLLFFGGHGEGPISYGTPGAANELTPGFKIYDPETSSKGYHSYPYTTKIWAYDLNDLIQVNNNIKTFDEIQPYAVWSVVLPGKDSYTAAGIQGVTYDPSNRRIYISQQVVDNYRSSGNYGSVIVHAYECNNAAIAPGITTTSLPPLVVGESYNATLSATGDPTITWSLVNGTLPDGLSLNTSTGAIVGTPAEAVVTTLIFRATNSVGFEEKTLTTGETLNGVSIQVAPVVNGVAGSYQSLSSLVQMTSWIDGEYVQDFWRSTTVIDGTVFVISRERQTDRVELWMYQPPASADKPSNSSAFDYTWNVGTTAAEIEDDRTYDVQITVNGSLITPQYSTSTTTRVLCAPGTVRRLVTDFKSWDWSKVDSAIDSYRLPGYNVNSLGEIATESSIPNAVSTIGSKPSESFNHAALGGPNSNNWFDGDHSPSGGGSQAGRSLSQSWEAIAISDRINNVSTYLSDYENILRKAAEYSGTFPQYTFLDPVTLKPYDAQKGEKPWTASGPASYNCPGSTYIPQRTNYAWDTAHHYNNGHVAFEATRDPFYALLLQCNAMVALSECSAYTRSNEILRFYSNVPRDNNGNVICPLPKYVISNGQERSRWWSLSTITKAKLATDLSPTADFLQPSTMWNTVINDGADMLYHYMADIDSVTAMPAQVTNSTEAVQATKFIQKMLSCYDLLFSDYENGVVNGTGHPIAIYASTFMGSGYGTTALVYMVAAGISRFQSALEKYIKFSCNRIIHAGGERAWSGFGQRGSAYPIVPGFWPTGTNTGLVWPIAPVPFQNAAGWGNYWQANYPAWAAKSKIAFNVTPNTFGDYFINFIQPVRAVKKLNTIGKINILSADIDAAMSAYSNMISASNGYVKIVASSSWPHRALSWDIPVNSDPIPTESPSISIWNAPPPPNGSILISDVSFSVWRSA
jgi:hypothetical protein